MLPIICENVLSGSVIYTDEHRSYSRLTEEGYLHGTICHKHNFVDRNTNVHTQAVESIKNLIKEGINTRSGVLTAKRESYFKVTCLLFNNLNCLFEKILELIKC